MANKDRVHPNSEEVIEDRPYCMGTVERYSKKKERMVQRRCRVQSTLLGDEYGQPACQQHGGRPDPKRQRAPRSKALGAVSYQSPASGGKAVMGYGQNSSHSSRWNMLCSGQLTVEDLDVEELAKGMVRDADGVIRGRASKMVPRGIAEAMKRELFERANQTLESDLVSAAELLGEIARDPEVETQHRIRAADMILNRVLGKAPETVRIGAEKPYEQMLTKIMRVSEEPSDPMIIEMREETGDDRF